MPREPIYRLTDREWRYLQDDDPGGYTRSELDPRIESKIATLPVRFTSLTADIADMQAVEFGENKLWENVWAGLLDVKNIPSNITPSEAREIIESGDIEGEPDASRLGRKLGDMLQSLQRDLPSSDPIEDKHDIIWGFIYGLLIPEDASIETGETEERLSNLFADLQSRKFEKPQEVNDQRQQIIDRENFAKTLRDHVDRIIQTGNFELPEVGTSLTYRPYRLEETETIDFTSIDELDELETYLREVLTTLVIQLIVNEYEDPEERKVDEQWEKFAIEHSVEEIINEWDENRVRSIVADNMELLTFNLELARDVYRILKHKWRGITAEEVFKEVCKNPGSTTGEIADSITKRNRSAVSRLLKDFAGVELEDRDPGNHSKLISEEEKGGSNTDSEWFLTLWGKRVGALLIQEPNVLLPSYFHPAPSWEEVREGGM